MAQAEQLKQQTLATLSDRDHQLRRLTAMLEEARAQKPKLEQEHYQREVGKEKILRIRRCLNHMFKSVVSNLFGWLRLEMNQNLLVSPCHGL